MNGSIKIKETQNNNLIEPDFILNHNILFSPNNFRYPQKTQHHDKRSEER